MASLALCLMASLYAQAHAQAVPPGDFEVAQPV